MTWTCHEVCFRAESPIHIGWHRLGNILRTRYFVPTRTLWGAWTAAWARRQAPQASISSLADFYKQADEELAAWLRFTPLFIADKADRDDTELLRPRFGESGLKYGGISPGEFEKRYVNGLASTSIAAFSSTAEEGSLHEREYLFADQMHLAGYVFLHETAPAEWWTTVAHFSCGGCQQDGWGRLRLVHSRPVAASRELFGEFEWRSTGPTVVGQRGSHLAAYVAATDAEMDGETEAVSGRSWSEAGPGRHVEPLAFYWSPGSCLRGSASFSISPRGEWTVTAADA